MNVPDIPPESQAPEQRSHAPSSSAASLERQPGSRVLRIRVTDSETGRLRVNLALPIGLVRVAMRQGARLLPSGQESTDLLLRAERGELRQAAIISDEKHHEQIEVAIEGWTRTGNH